MKKIITLISIVTLLFSCKESEVAGVSPDAVKADLTAKLNKSEWKCSSSSSHFSKIEFDDQIIVLTTQNGGTQRVAFDVTNVPRTSLVIPDTIQLRLKSGFFLNEIYIKKDYSALRNVYRSNEASELTGEYEYNRVK